MKKYLLTILAVFATLSAFAQTVPTSTQVCKNIGNYLPSNSESEFWFKYGTQIFSIRKLDKEQRNDNREVWCEEICWELE